MVVVGVVGVVVVVVIVIVVAVVDVVVVAMIVSFYHSSSFSSVLSTLFSASKVGMTTTSTSFTSLHGDVVHHGRDGIIELSICHWIPPIYCSGFFSEGVCAGVGNDSGASTLLVVSVIETVGVG